MFKEMNFTFNNIEENINETNGVLVWIGTTIDSKTQNYGKNLKKWK